MGVGLIRVFLMLLTKTIKKRCIQSTVSVLCKIENATPLRKGKVRGGLDEEWKVKETSQGRGMRILSVGYRIFGRTMLVGLHSGISKKTPKCHFERLSSDATID